MAWKKQEKSSDFVPNRKVVIPSKVSVKNVEMMDKKLKEESYDLEAYGITTRSNLINHLIYKWVTERKKSHAEAR